MLATKPDNLVEFVSPILGFDDETSFTLSPLESTGTLWALRRPALPSRSSRTMRRRSTKRPWLCSARKGRS
jgi:hypothetical protein